MDGILNVYKEKGYTSHDVVARLRGICRQRHIGHTGTLDPAAEGVLPVCFGSATKVCDMLYDQSKEYRAELLLGITTDTQDTTGELITLYTGELPAEGQILAAINSFIGEYEQIPPMYSAVKVNGKKLYELARQGVEIEREARSVVIEDIKVLKFSLVDGHVMAPKLVEEGTILVCAELVVICSKGTYIRTLCHDIGDKLGCGGSMASLIRTRASSFTLAEAIRLDEIERLAAEEKLEERIIPVDRCFPDCPKFSTKAEDDYLLHNGNELHARQFEAMKGMDPLPEHIRLYDSCGTFYATYIKTRHKGLYRPEKMFVMRKKRA